MKPGSVGIILSWAITCIAVWFAYEQLLARGALLLRIQKLEQDFAAYQAISTPIAEEPDMQFMLNLRPGQDAQS